MDSVNKIKTELKSLSDPKRAKASAWFFKTAPGQYGFGDKFIGITVPVLRRVAQKYSNLDFAQIKKLLQSQIHEHRFVALEILVFKYEHGAAALKQKVFDFYLKNRKFINNWDLVDTSAPYIVGDYLLNRSKNLLDRLAASKNIWERRIAIVSTLGFIQKGKVQYTMKIAQALLHDRHDLIHKASGWALREVGKKSEQIHLKFLDKFAGKMPRTMLRYAIERLPEQKRKYYLNKKNDKRNF